ncbi:MAG: DnaJ domain-containing protein [Eubacteriaceae bacterium]|jgi:hypothetical protein|nr:DnaJ domain-containing protein [Eubacteriaceae bacterium]
MDYYKTLGVKRSASQDEIRTAYKGLAKKFHPDIYKGDKNYAEKIMQDVNVAYDTLSDPGKRERYDLSIPAVGYFTKNERTYQTSVRKVETPLKPAKDKKAHMPVGEVETWNTAPGRIALAFSAIIWLLYAITSSETMKLMLVFAYSALMALSVVIFVGIRFDVRIDVFFISIIYALLFSLVYNVVSVSILYEPFTIHENLVIVPLLACTISLMPATLTLSIVRFMRNRMKLKTSKPKKQ